MSYLREMGVDQDLFSEMTKGGRDDLNFLTAERLFELKAVTNGLSEISWTLEAAGPHGLYLRGRRDTIWGEQKIMFMNAGKDVRLLALIMFDPQGRDSEIVKMSAISLMLDDETVNIPEARVALKPIVADGWARMMIALEDHLIQKMLASETIGFIVRYSYQAPFFLGVAGMHFSEGAVKLRAFMASNQHRQ